MEPRASTGTSIRRAALWAVLALPACTYTPGRSFSNVCPSTDVALCDVRLRACRQQVGDYVACLAERDFLEPPTVLTSTRARPRDPYAQWLEPVRPALLMLQLSETTTVALPVEPWDYAGGVIERAELSVYDDRAAVTGLGFAMAMALYDQTEGWSGELARRPDFDSALALRAVWTGVATLWADHLDAALAGESYFDRAPAAPPTLPGEGLERDALNLERRFAAGRYAREWSQDSPASRQWVEAPPESIGSLSLGDDWMPQPVSELLNLPRSTLVALNHAALGPFAWEVWQHRPPEWRGRVPLGDRLFVIEDTVTGQRGALWALTFGGGTFAVVASHSDPEVRAALQAAGEALLEQ